MGAGSLRGEGTGSDGRCSKRMAAPGDAPPAADGPVPHAVDQAQQEEQHPEGDARRDIRDVQVDAPRHDACKRTRLQLSGGEQAGAVGGRGGRAVAGRAGRERSCSTEDVLQAIGPQMCVHGAALSCTCGAARSKGVPLLSRAKQLGN